MYLTTLVLSGLLTGLLLSGFIYFDAARREIPIPSRLFGIAFVVVTSLGAFLIPYLFTTELSYLYFQVIKGSGITVHPREFVVVSIAAGVILSVGAALVYVTASRGWHAGIRSDADM